MKRSELWALGASAAAGAMVTAGFPWLPVLGGWLLGALTVLVLPRFRRRPGRGMAAAGLTGAVLLMAGVLLGAERAFPQESTFPFVSLGLLFILWQSLRSGKRACRTVENVLGILLLGGMALLLLPGLWEIRWRENAPAPGTWRQLFTAWAITAPWWILGKSRDRPRLWLFLLLAAAAGTGMSLLTHGTLGAALAEWEPFPLYRAVQASRLLGRPRRMEELAAAILLLGSFCLLLPAGEVGARCMSILAPEGKNRLQFFLLCLSAFLTEWAARSVRSTAKVGVETIFWGLVPLFALWVVVFGENAKK